jgi:tRNA(Ile)-lysidine synthase
LRSRLEAGASFTATLAGARVECDAILVRVTREAGDIARAGASLRRLPAGEPIAWDGRFEIAARIEGLSVAPLAGLAARLERGERAALSRVSPAARKAAPAIVDGAGRVTAPLFAHDERLSLRSLIADRFFAACGAVVNEADARLRSESAQGSLNPLPIPTRRVHEPA